MKRDDKHVRLGYEVGSGSPVEIPVRHMVICGQTQEAGKTTTLEALIERSGLRALSFVTKRGEGAFADGRVIAPYFREQADWRFVSSLLEAFLHERLKFERSWIMRATKGARTLGDVRRNIAKLQGKAKGLSADIYMVLGEYLDELVPTIAAVKWAPGVDLAAGVNVMNLIGIPDSMQHLVVKSAIDWCHEREHDVVVVVPEAWKFIPEGRGTPVKLSAANYIRQGAGIRNYLWLDSQDIGGVSKELLRSCPVWLLGVQRETNEIKRTLANIHAGIAKPKAGDVASLDLGQFYACWGRHAVKTYVQPAWMEPGQACGIALGNITVDQAVRHRRSIEREAAAVERRFLGRTRSQEDEVNAAEAQALREDNDRLRKDNEDLRRRIAALEGERTAGPDHRSDRADTRQDLPHRGDDGRAARARELRPDAPTSSTGRPRTFSAEESFDNEALYQAIKSRLIEEAHNDPAVLAIVLNRPELQVKIRRQILEVDGDSLRGRIGRLIHDGFFDRSHTSSEILVELEKRGETPSNIEFGNEMKALVRMGFFTRENKWYSLVPEMKVNVVEAVEA